MRISRRNVLAIAGAGVVPFWSPPRSVAPGGGRHRRASFAHLSDLHISTPAAPASLGRELSANDPQERGQITAPGDGTGTRPGPQHPTAAAGPVRAARPGRQRLTPVTVTLTDRYHLSTSVTFTWNIVFTAARVLVPNLTGDDLTSAEAELRAAGLILGDVRTANDPSCTRLDKVMDQSPAATGQVTRAPRSPSTSASSRRECPAQ